VRVIDLDHFGRVLAVAVSAAATAVQAPWLVVG